MILLNPKILALLALLGLAVYVTSPKTDARLVEKASDAGTKHLRKTTDEYTRMKQQAQTQSDRLTGQLQDVRPPPKPPLTVAELVAAMKEGIRHVPRYVPNLPMMGGLADAFLELDKDAIAFDPNLRHAYGVFDWSDPKRLKIRLSPRLQELHRKGVPAKLLAPILVHELEHMISYLYRHKRPGRRRRQDEHGAFTAEVYYLMGIGYGRDGAAEPVDATGYDPEREEYLRDLKRIRKQLFTGELKGLIEDRYSTDDVLHSHEHEQSGSR